MRSLIHGSAGLASVFLRTGWCNRIPAFAWGQGGPAAVLAGVGVAVSADVEGVECSGHPARWHADATRHSR